jgi:hypothetical protein
MVARSKAEHKASKGDPVSDQEKKERADDPDVEGHLKKENMDANEEPDVEGHQFNAVEELEEKKE